MSVAAQQSPIEVARGAVAILDVRVSEAGQAGLTLWTSCAAGALREEQRRRADATEKFHEALAALDVSGTATRAALFAAIERANRKLSAIVERGILVVALACIVAAGLNGDDDLARKAPRGRSGRRRDDVVALCDAETGEDMA
jgi:hypothetical protein